MAPIVIDAPLSDSIRANKKFFKKSHGNKSTKGVQKRSGANGKPFDARKPVRFQNDSTKGNQNVRVNISNLAATVTLEDLKELFVDFKTQNISLNASQNGTFGTGTVTLPQKAAFQLMNKFRGVAIDGVEMRFSMNMTSRVVFPGAVPKGNKRGSYRKPAAGGKKAVKAQKDQKRSPPRKMSTEELDAALDAYMS